MLKFGGCNTFTNLEFLSFCLLNMVAFSFTQETPIQGEILLGKLSDLYFLLRLRCVFACSNISKSVQLEFFMLHQLISDMSECCKFSGLYNSLVVFGSFGIIWLHLFCLKAMWNALSWQYPNQQLNSYQQPNPQECLCSCWIPFCWHT